MKRQGYSPSSSGSPSAHSLPVPTDKPSRRLFYSEEELRELFDVWTELRNPGRRRRPEYIGQRLTFNQWLKGLTSDGAALARRALAAGAAAPTSGTVERPMTPAKPKRPAKTTEAAPAKARRGRPPGRSENSEAVYTSVTPKQKLELEKRATRRRKAEGLSERWGVADILRELIAEYLSKPLP